MARGMNQYLARNARSLRRRRCGFSFPNHFDAELRLGAGRGDDGSCLPREFQAELDLNIFGSTCEVAKLTSYRYRCRFYGLNCSFKAIANRLDDLVGMQPARNRPPGCVLDFDQDTAAGFQRVGDKAFHR
jgi:hypothetical protein